MQLVIRFSRNTQCKVGESFSICDVASELTPKQTIPITGGQMSGFIYTNGQVTLCPVISREANTATDVATSLYII